MPTKPVNQLLEEQNGLISRLTLADAPLFTTFQVTLATTAKRVLAAAADVDRRFVEVKNTDASISMYIGYNSAVSSTTGHLLKAGEAFDWDNYVGEIWFVAASGTPVVSVIWW